MAWLSSRRAPQPRKISRAPWQQSCAPAAESERPACSSSARPSPVDSPRSEKSSRACCASSRASAWFCCRKSTSASMCRAIASDRSAPAPSRSGMAALAASAPRASCCRCTSTWQRVSCSRPSHSLSPSSVQMVRASSAVFCASLSIPLLSCACTSASSIITSWRLSPAFWMETRLSSASFSACTSSSRAQWARRRTPKARACAPRSRSSFRKSARDSLAGASACSGKSPSRASSATVRSSWASCRRSFVSL
mmetsp:Transcript_35623/g.101774  ORF Transcript_35623/g.101774 Transcript_35623/m.101774 type:complete len:252 (-) Transcript_35623:182-937(-)